jgi:hypothetical protein
MITGRAVGFYIGNIRGIELGVFICIRELGVYIGDIMGSVVCFYLLNTMCSEIVVCIGNIIGRGVCVSIYNILRTYVSIYIQYQGRDVGVYIGNMIGSL